MPHEIIGTAQCRLCGTKFQGPAAVIVGDGPNQRLSQYLVAITHHWVHHHEKEDQFLQIRAGEFLGLLRLMQFQSTDPALNTQKDKLRWKIHTSTRNVSITDASLLGIAGRIAETVAVAVLAALPQENRGDALIQSIIQATTAAVSPCLKEFRDTYEEPDKYAGQKAPAGLLV